MHVQPQGRISTFYSYKGGTGRTMALANVAWILASRGKRVLAIDWDLEAPGLHRYFSPLVGDPKLASSPGLIDFLLDYWIAATHPDEDDDPRWFERHADLAALALPVLADFPGGGRLDVVGAGRQDGGYAERVTSFDWKAFYASFGGAGFLDLVFAQLRQEYDYVLIDSRTGVSDTAGICTVQLPDSLVVFFTLNNQSIEGASAIAHDARAQRDAAGGPRLAVFPVPSRIDLFERDKLEVRRSLVRQRFTDLLDLDDAARKRYFAEIELLYVPFYSYEEQLATIVDRPNQHASLLGSFERLTGHVSGGEVRQLVTMSDALRADFRAKYDAFHRSQAPGAGEPDERWDIFLSHASEDRATAMALHRQLQPRFKTFFGVDAIAPGQNIVETTARAMTSSNIAVILISRAALASTTLAAEVDALLANDLSGRKATQTLRTKRVLPVLIGVEPDELPESLAPLRAYRALAVPADEQAAVAAARAIMTALGETPEVEPARESSMSIANPGAAPLGGTAEFRSDAPPTTNQGAGSPIVAHRRTDAGWWIAGAAVLAAIGFAVVAFAGWPSGTVGANVFVDQVRHAKLRRKLERQEEQLHRANQELERERGMRATLLAGDHARVVEALVLGVKSVGAYDTTHEVPPAETSTGLLAALTKIGSDATLMHTLEGHRNGISTLLYAGSTIASVDGTGVIRLWDSGTGKLLATPNDYKPAPTRIALASDGSQIAWSTPDAVVHVWRIAANEEFASFGPLPNEIRELTFWEDDEDHDNLAIATSRSVYVYDLENRVERSIASKKLGDYNQIDLAEGTPRFAFDTASAVELFALDRVRDKELWPSRVAQLDAPTGLSSLQVLADGLHLLVATPVNLEIHDVESRSVTSLQSSLTSQPRLAVASKAPVIALGWSDDPTVRTWSAEPGLGSFRPVDEGIADLALAPDGSRVAVLGRAGNDCTLLESGSVRCWSTGVVQIWQLQPPRRLTTVVSDAAIDTMTFGPDGERLATGSSDGSVRVWSLRQRKSWDIGDAGQPIRDLDVLGSGLLAAAGDDRVTRIWDLRSGSELVRLPTTSTTVTSLALVPGTDGRPGSVVLTGPGSPTRLVDLDALLNQRENATAIAELLGSSVALLSLAVSPDGNTIAAGDREANIYLWDRRGKLLPALGSVIGSVEALAFSPDGKRLASGNDRTVLVWDLATGELLPPFEGHLSSIKSLSFSPDGTWIASTSGDKIARAWALDGSRSLTLEGHAAPLTAIAFLPDGKRLVTTSEDSTLRIWTLESGESITLTGHAAKIRSVDVSPDGKSIVTASDDGTARIWSVDGKPIATLVGHRTGLLGARFTDGGKLLITASSDGDLRIWPTTPHDWLAAGCDQLFERAEYGQVAAICERFEFDRRPEEPRPNPIEVQLDPKPAVEQGKHPKNWPRYDPTGKPRTPPRLPAK
jgi:WD40 repeat protein